MGFELNEGQGSLFKNDKNESEKRPDYKGSIKIDGQEYWLSAWIKDSTKGKFMSLSAQPKTASNTGLSKPANKSIGGDFDDMENFVPF